MWATVHEHAWGIEAFAVRACVVAVLVLILCSCTYRERTRPATCRHQCARPFEVVRPVLPRGVPLHEAHQLKAWVAAYNRLMRHCATLHAASWWSGPIPDPVRHYVQSL